jgi:hypothetical protein
MILTFFRQHRAGAIEYLTNAALHPAACRVMRGIPELTRGVCRNLHFQQRYGTGGPGAGMILTRPSKAESWTCSSGPSLLGLARTSGT